MTIEQEIYALIQSMDNTPVIIDDDKEITAEIEGSFAWCGSKIDWSKTAIHRSYCLSKSSEAQNCAVVQFIKRYGIDREIAASKEIYYINDCSISFAVRLDSVQFFPFITLALEYIPEHHYFFERQRKWCLCVTMNGLVDFGFSQEVKSKFSYKQSKKKYRDRK